MSKWLVETAQKEMLDYCECFINLHREQIQNNRVYIFGAGVRGTIFARLLEEKGYTQFSFLDNGEEKWGMTVGGHEVLSPAKALDNIDNVYIVISIEYARQIVGQFTRDGLVSEKQFDILQPPICDNYVDEFRRDMKNEWLFLGGTALNEIEINEQNRISLKDMIYRDFGYESTRILAMNCMSMRTLYYILDGLINTGKKPEKLCLFITFESLTPFHHLLPRSQQPELLTKINEVLHRQDEEYREYIQLVEERTRDYSIELKYSPKRVGADSEKDDILRDYAGKLIFEPMDENGEEIIYLKKIIKLMSDMVKRNYIFILPINYQAGIRLLGEEFRYCYNEKLNSVKRIISDIDSDIGVFDASYTLDERQYEYSGALTDVYTYEGRNKIMEIVHKMVLE